MLDYNTDFEMLVDFINPTFRFQKQFRICIPDRSELSGDSAVFPPVVGKVSYTDISLCNSKSGAAIFKQNTNPVELQYSLGSYTSVFQSEIFAIAVCAKEIIDSGKTNMFRLGDKLITGHCRLNEHMKIMGLRDSALSDK